MIRVLHALTILFFCLCALAALVVLVVVTSPMWITIVVMDADKDYMQKVNKIKTPPPVDLGAPLHNN